jgi:hypothetical protein
MFTEPEALLRKPDSSLPFVLRAWSGNVRGVRKVKEQQVGIDPVEFPQIVEVGEPVGVLVKGGLPRGVWGDFERCLGPLPKASLIFAREAVLALLR